MATNPTFCQNFPQSSQNCQKKPTINTWNSIFQRNGFTAGFAFENLTFQSYSFFKCQKVAKMATNPTFCQNFPQSSQKMSKRAKKNTWNSIFQGNGFTASFTFENLPFPSDFFFKCQKVAKMITNTSFCQNFPQSSQKIVKKSQQ